VTVTTHDLYDIYAPSFDAAINNANVRSGMSAYHCLNDEPLVMIIIITPISNAFIPNLKQIYV